MQTGQIKVIMTFENMLHLQCGIPISFIITKIVMYQLGNPKRVGEFKLK